MVPVIISVHDCIRCHASTVRQEKDIKGYALEMKKKFSLITNILLSIYKASEDQQSILLELIRKQV